MRIKRLELHGFKSFLERTALTFPPGITAVVGPNGCGKSNIVDAIRWVLGEQSPKNMRCKNMEDVISVNGKNPANFAEINLILETDSTQMPVEFAGLSEIMITRRLFRGGDSEYALNKKNCRLKDVQYLFMDTGVGTNAYSIIDQGRIGSSIDCRPEERRAMIEEVAGITKYKVKRREAQVKIVKTRENLDRLGDMLAEVGRHRQTLKRQARKTMMYLQFKEELKGLELALAARRFAFLNEVIKAREGDLAGLKMQEEEARTSVSRLELLEEEIALELIAAEEKQKALAQNCYAGKARIQDLENRRRELIEQISRSEYAVAKGREEQKTVEQRLAETGEGKAQVSKKKEEVLGRLSLFNEELAVQESFFHQKKLGLDDKTRAVERARLKLGDISGQEKHLVSRRDELTRRRLDLGRRTMSLKNEEGAKIVETGRLKQELLQEEEALTAVNAGIASLQEELLRTEEEERVLAVEMIRDRDLMQRAKEEIAAQKSRLETLRHTFEQYEGVAKGNRYLARFEESFSGRLLAEQLETDPGWERAVEAALGERLQFLFTTNLAAGKKAIELLKDKNAGRAGLVVLSPEGDESSPLPPSPEHIHPCSLWHKVRVREEVALVDPSAAARLSFFLHQTLPSILWARDFDAALNLYSAEQGRYQVADLGGDVIRPTGELEGGDEAAAPFGLLSLRQDMARQEEAIVGIFKGIEEREENLRDIAAQKKEHEETRIVIRSRLKALEQKRNLAEKARIRLREQLVAANDTLFRVARQLEELSGEEENLTAKQDETEAAISALRLKNEEERAGLEGLEQEIILASEALEQERETLTELKLEFAANQERKNHLARELDAVIRQEKELSGQLKRIGEQIAAKGRQKEEGENGLRLLEEEFSLDKARLEQLLLNEREGQEQCRNLQDRSLVAKSDLKNQGRRLREFHDAIHHLEIDITEAKINRKHLAEKIFEHYQVMLDRLDAEEVQSWIARAPEPEQAEEMVKLAKEKIEGLGPINLAAVQEYEEEEKRYEFLVQQQTDLMTAIESLNEAIRKINRISRERFIQTLGDINEKLAIVFPILFTGGSAKMSMADGDDPLEAGVDLYIGLPGKRVQHLSLMSGGEKALSAIALLFAIYLIKPSPFCILDEIDAALDDPNTNRFKKLLREMGRDSQIILITHNKGVMEAADTLHGVTMEEKGVSKFVSVKLN